MEFAKTNVRGYYYPISDHVVVRVEIGEDKRVGSNFGTAEAAGVQSLEYEPNGCIQCISLANFTGRLIFLHQEQQHQLQQQRKQEVQLHKQQESIEIVRNDVEKAENSLDELIPRELVLDSLINFPSEEPSSSVPLLSGTQGFEEPKPSSIVLSPDDATSLLEDSSSCSSASEELLVNTDTRRNEGDEELALLSAKAHLLEPPSKPTPTSNPRQNFSYFRALGYVGNRFAATVQSKQKPANKTSAERNVPQRMIQRAPSFVHRREDIIDAGRCTIPEYIRQQRNELRMALNPVSTTSPGELLTTAFTSELHELCAQPSFSMEDAIDCLRKNPTAVRTRDSQGRYPLHILGDNETIISTTRGRETATSFASHLINEYPVASKAWDKEGFIPFSRIIRDWIEWSGQTTKAKKGHPFDTFPRNTSMRDSAPTAFFYPGHQRMFGSDNNRTEASVMMNFLPLRKVSKRLFPRVVVWEEVEWCFSMISTSMDILGRNHSLPMFQRIRTNTSTSLPDDDDDDDDEERDGRTLLVHRLISKLPQIMCTILLVDDDGLETRTRLLKTSLVRRFFLCPMVLDKWVVNMLNHGGVPAKRAVDFLVAISSTTIDDYTGGFAVHAHDSDAFNERRQAVFDGAAALKGTIASLVTLDTKETERAASTAVVWEIMNNKLSRPFVLGLVLMDMVFHLILMVAFRSIANVGTSLTRTIQVDPTGLVFVISIHYLLRKGCEAWVLLTVSASAFRAYFANMWTLIDVAAIVLTLCATIYHLVSGGEMENGLNTVVIGLLYFKVLAFLKVVNKDLATFILALSQILYDIRLFMIVLAVCVLMFGDMFFVATSRKDNGNWCASHAGNSSSTIDDFCSNSWASYLRVYSILLGDFNLDNITATLGTTVLFIIFTVFGVVVLLNVLIAVISDSYKSAKQRGAMLFGRARVLYVAQNEALEEFLRPRTTQRSADTSSSSRSQQFSRREQGKSHCLNPYRLAHQLLRYAVLSAVLATTIYAQLFLFKLIIPLGLKKTYGLMCIVALTALFLFCGLWVITTCILDELIRGILPSRVERLYDVITTSNASLVRMVSHGLFGLKSGVAGSSSEETEADELTNRINYLETVIERVMDKTKAELKSEILDVKTEMQKHFDQGK